MCIVSVSSVQAGSSLTHDRLKVNLSTHSRSQLLSNEHTSMGVSTHVRVSIHTVDFLSGPHHLLKLFLIFSINIKQRTREDNR